jgi:hypothetical protein
MTFNAVKAKALASASMVALIAFSAAIAAISYEIAKEHSSK